jgi:hypothetical protein
MPKLRLGIILPIAQLLLSWILFRAGRHAAAEGMGYSLCASCQPSLLWDHRACIPAYLFIFTCSASLESWIYVGAESTPSFVHGGGAGRLVLGWKNARQLEVVPGAGQERDYGGSRHPRRCRCDLGFTPVHCGDRSHPFGSPHARRKQHHRLFRGRCSIRALVLCDGSAPRSKAGRRNLQASDKIVFRLVGQSSAPL